MKKVQKFLATVLACCLLLTIFTVAASADNTANAAQCWNIMLVIDGSRSLSSGYGGVATDPEGLRYEAIDSLIDTLQDKGQYVGAIVFMANPGMDTSEKDMYRGIKLDTWSNGPVSIENNKSTLKKQIKNADLSTAASGDVGETDIGTALYWAEKRLEEAHEQNGLPGAVFLFTDGLNALTYPGPQQQSEENMEKATEALRNNGFPLCGVFLNASKKTVDPTEVRDIVCKANGISAGDLDLGNYFIEIKNAADCSKSTDKFMELLGFHFGSDSGETIKNSCDKTFRIPGTGVEEVNIRLRTLDGESLPSGTSVTITKPDGTVLSGATTAAICSSGRTYQLYKISDPEAGTWSVHIDLPSNNTVSIDYNPIFSIYVEPEFESTPATDDLHANMNADIQCFLTQNGQRVTDGDDYREYSCELEVTNTTTGDIETYEITKNGNDEFVISLPLDYGVYDVRTSFTCDQVGATSKKTTWYLENHAPVATGLETPINFSILSVAGMSKDISDYYDDVEDGKNLQLSLVEEVKGVEINNNELKINPFSAKSGVATVRATDSQGAYVDFDIQLINATVRYVLILLAAIFVVLLIIFLLIRRRNSFIPKGVCTLEFEVLDEDARGNERECELSVELAAPGNGTKRKTTLYDMINADLNREAGSIRSECEEQDISFREVERFLDRIETDLRKAKVSCVIGTQKGAGKIAKVKVDYGKTKSVLFNNSVKLVAGGNAMSFGYYLRAAENDDDGYGNYSSDDDVYSSDSYSSYDDSYSDSYSSSSYPSSSDDEI